MTNIKKRNKLFEPIICEECNMSDSVIIHEKVYYCADCYIFLVDIPWDNALANIKKNGFYSKLKN